MQSSIETSQADSIVFFYIYLCVCLCVYTHTHTTILILNYHLERDIGGIQTKGSCPQLAGREEGICISIKEYIFKQILHVLFIKKC